jgi:hypothetical protein
VNDPRKTRGPVDGASASEQNQDVRADANALPTPDNTPRSGRTRLDRIVMHDVIALDWNVAPKTKLVAGAFAARPHQSVTRRQVQAAIPWIYNDDFQDALTAAWTKGWAYVDRSGNADGRPVKMRWNAPFDSWRVGMMNVHVPVAGLARLSGKAAPFDAMLFTLLCIEQKRRRGIQVPDYVLARKLGCSERHAADARRRILAAGALTTVRDKIGRYNTAIYQITDAFRDAPADFDPDSPDRFNEAKTRYDLKFRISNGVDLVVHANELEIRLIEIRVGDANANALEQLHALAAQAAAQNAIIQAKELLNGLLHEKDDPRAPTRTRWRRLRRQQRRRPKARSKAARTERRAWCPQRAT